MYLLHQWDESWDVVFMAWLLMFFLSSDRTEVERRKMPHMMKSFTWQAVPPTQRMTKSDWVEMIELFLNCAKFTIDEVQYRSLTNVWNLHFCYLALNYLKAKANSSLICSMLRTESGLRFALWISDMPPWPFLIPVTKKMGELFGLAFSAVFENTEHMTL